MLLLARSELTWDYTMLPHFFLHNSTRVLKRMYPSSIVQKKIFCFTLHLSYRLATINSIFHIILKLQLGTLHFTCLHNKEISIYMYVIILSLSFLTTREVPNGSGQLLRPNSTILVHVRSLIRYMCTVQNLAY